MTKVLVVEDELKQQLIIFKILKTLGLKIIFADNGHEALEQVKRHCPDLVVLDVIMPRMNGYEVCRRLKANQKTQTIPVLMYSAKKIEDCDLYWANKQGADAYLSKLCHPHELINMVKCLLRNKATGKSPLCPPKEGRQQATGNSILPCF
ncbi:MAG: response regulator [Symploca sp. SIO2G7]|nr:response regulator [Symploca sp. SIO2G7]